MTTSLAARCRRHAPDPGLNRTAIDGVGIYRVDHPQPPTNAVYGRGIFLVASGRKRTVAGADAFEYDPDHYLVTSVPLPVVSEVLEACPERPFLALTLALDVDEARELLLTSPALQGSPPPGPPERGLAAAPLPARMRDAALRLATLLDEPADIPALAPLIRREILYYVLQGPQGAFVRALALGAARHRSMDDVLRAIHLDCARPVAVPDLARRAGMSETTFFEAFRTVTGATPLQYVKRLRLLEAHRRIAHGLDSVSGAAASVGYQSHSQFSREFTRMFGVNPSQLTAAPGR
jgi:AraC-like DNA-binding protein